MKVLLAILALSLHPAQWVTAQLTTQPTQALDTANFWTQPTTPVTPQQITWPPAYEIETATRASNLPTLAPPPSFQGPTFQPPAYRPPADKSTSAHQIIGIVPLAPAAGHHPPAAYSPLGISKQSTRPPAFQLGSRELAIPIPAPPLNQPQPFAPVVTPDFPITPSRPKVDGRNEPIFRLLQHLPHDLADESPRVGPTANPLISIESDYDVNRADTTITNEFFPPIKLHPPNESYRPSDDSKSDGSVPPPALAGAVPSAAATASDEALTDSITDVPFEGSICDPGCGCTLCVSPFSPDPDFSSAPFDPAWEWDVYDGKWFDCKQAPWIEWGRGIYGPGPVPRSKYFLGETNPVSPSFLLYGDYRTAVAYNDVGGNDKVVWGHRLNLEFDFKFTATERIHAFWGPLDRGVPVTRIEANDNEFTFTDEFDEDFDTLFFEGDLGYIWGSFTDQYAPFDLPFTFGRLPLFFQNGVWFNEVIEGFAFTIPTRHSRLPLISNYEITYFFGFDDVASPAFGNDDNAANIYGVHGFFEMWEGYLEMGHAYLDDRSGQGLSYHNFGVSFSRRYCQRVSNATRVLVSTGQTAKGGAPDTADGTLVLWENAWISRNPNYFVPYFNMFAGFGRPQSAARLLDNVLVNTGINFETDLLTGYPTLDASGNDTWGGALGVNWLGPDFSWQWIVELAFLQTFGDQGTRNAPGDQYALGTRYQIPLNYSWILRMDAMYGLLEDADNLTGARAELRWKF